MPVTIGTCLAWRNKNLRNYFDDGYYTMWLLETNHENIGKQQRIVRVQYSGRTMRKLLRNYARGG